MTHLKTGIFTLEWTTDVEVLIFDSFNKQKRKCNTHIEHFQKGQRVEADIFDDLSNCVNLQFIDGGIATVGKEDFKLC